MRKHDADVLADVITNEILATQKIAAAWFSLTPKERDDLQERIAEILRKANDEHS